MHILVATDREVLVIDVERGTSALARGIDDRPTYNSLELMVNASPVAGQPHPSSAPKALARSRSPPCRS